MTNNFKSIPSNLMFDALKNEKAIVMACNVRITKGILKGIFKAAKKTDSAVIMELAKSESDLTGGYTGLKPKDFAEQCREAASETGFDIWSLHADHMTIKKGTEEEIQELKKLIDAQISAGFNSFALDASFLFDFEGKTVEEELKQNIDVTAELAEYIKEKMVDKEFGLEVEVGEIGKKNEQGMILTTPEEAVVFIRELNKKGVFPNVIGIANGSTHGNIYDEKGHSTAQISINLEQTKAVAEALKKEGFNVRLAQHGITGTPRELIKKKFPAGDILKGNVGTFWQNIFFEVLKVMEPELYTDLIEWTLENFREKAMEKGCKSDEEIIGKYIKFATTAKDENGKLLFFNRIYSLRNEVELALESRAYAEAILFFEAFHSKGSAEIIRKHIKRIKG